MFFVFDGPYANIEQMCNPNLRQPTRREQTDKLLTASQRRNGKCTLFEFAWSDRFSPPEINCIKSALIAEAALKAGRSNEHGERLAVAADIFLFKWRASAVPSDFFECLGVQLPVLAGRNIG